MTFYSRSLAPLSADRGVQGGTSKFFPDRLVLGHIQLEAVKASSLPLPGPLPWCGQTWG